MVFFLPDGSFVSSSFIPAVDIEELFRRSVPSAFAQEGLLTESVGEWVIIITRDEMATTAILDRILHRVHMFNIDGKSYRSKDLEIMTKGHR